MHDKYCRPEFGGVETCNTKTKIRLGIILSRANMTLSRRHAVTLSRCHAVTLSRCHFTLYLCTLARCQAKPF